MDVRFPEGSGADACRAIRDSCPDTRLLFLFSYQDNEAVLSAVFEGASGYLLKHVNAEGLLRAIHALAQGAVDPRPGYYTASLDPHEVAERRGI